MFTDRWLDRATDEIVRDLLHAMGRRESILDMPEEHLIAGLRRAVRRGLRRSDPGVPAKAPRPKAVSGAGRGPKP